MVFTINHIFNYLATNKSTSNTRHNKISKKIYKTNNNKIFWLKEIISEFILWIYVLFLIYAIPCLFFVWLYTWIKLTLKYKRR